MLHFFDLASAGQCAKHLCRMRSPPPRRGRSRTPEKKHHKTSLSRSKSRSRSRSPRSPPRHGGRYKCEPPKYPPSTRARTIPDVSKRYDDMYIPPEFCRVGASWVDSLAEETPLNLLQPIDFQVKKVCRCPLCCAAVCSIACCTHATAYAQVGCAPLRRLKGRLETTWWKASSSSPDWLPLLILDTS